MKMSKFPNLSSLGKLQTAYELLNQVIEETDHNCPGYVRLVNININLGVVIKTILDKAFKNDTTNNP